MHNWPVDPFPRPAIRSAGGYRYARAAENLAAGVDTPDAAVALWMRSPGHRANILNCQLRETGVGYIVDSSDRLNYGVYWTEDFGTR